MKIADNIPIYFTLTSAIGEEEDNKPPSHANGNKGWFLEQFTGLGSEDVTISDMQPIAKATKTSQPIINAVNISVKQIKAYINSEGGVANE